MRAIFNALFGSKRKNGATENVNAPAPRIAGAPFDYHFNPVALPNAPGPAYVAPLLQFQEYPRTMVQGAGIAYARGFQAFEPMTVQQQLQPVLSGTSGSLHGQLFGQPLTDTSGVSQ